MFPSPEPRLILRIGDPLIGDTFLAIAGPHETDGWAEVAIKRLKALLQTRRPLLRQGYHAIQMPG